MGWTANSIEYIHVGEAEAFVILDKKNADFEAAVRSFLDRVNKIAPKKCSILLKVGRSLSKFSATIEISSYKGRFFFNDVSSDLDKLLIKVSEETFKHSSEWKGIGLATDDNNSASYGCF